MHKISVKPGDLVFVAGGVPHAIGGGGTRLKTEFGFETDKEIAVEVRRVGNGVEVVSKLG